jgi:hypothetical protein
MPTSVAVVRKRYVQFVALAGSLIVATTTADRESYPDRCCTPVGASRLRSASILIERIN